MPRKVKGRHSKVFDALASPMRLNILYLIDGQGPLAYSEIMESLNLNPSKDAGKFAYHLRNLVVTDLIDSDQQTRKYFLTDLGRMIVNFSQDVKEYSKKGERKLYVRTSRLAVEEFDRKKIVQALIREAGAPADLAEKISREAEERLLRLPTKYLTAPLIREFVNAILIEKGLEEYRHKLTRLGFPVYDVTQKILRARRESLDVEAIHKMAGNRVIGEYTLLNILPRKVADAHLSGYLHICNTGNWVLRVNEVQHDLRIFLRDGVRYEEVTRFSAAIDPPNTFSEALSTALTVLTRSTNEVTVEASAAFFNVFLSPFMEDTPPEEVREALKTFVLNISQLNYSGYFPEVTVSLDPRVPDHLKDVEAVGPKGGRRGTYRDFEEEAQSIFDAFIDSMLEDGVSKPVFTPHVTVNVRNEGDKDELLGKAHQLASKYGTPYFANLTSEGQSDSTYTSTGTQLAADWTGDWELDTLRTGSMDCVLLNLPRIAYESRGNDDKFGVLVEELVGMAVEALKIKHSTLDKRMRQDLLPFIAQRHSGEPYFRLDSATYLLSFIGLNEAVKAHVGHQIFEDEDAMAFALKVVGRMVEEAKRHTIKPYFRLAVSQSPGGDATKRLAELDIEKYGWANVCVQGTKDHPYYTEVNAVPLEAKLPLRDRLSIEGQIQALTTGGQMALIQLESEKISPQKLLAQTGAAIREHGLKAFAYTKNLTYCANCVKTYEGVLQKCPKCGAVQRLVNYGRCSTRYLPLQLWNSAKRRGIGRRVGYAL